MVTAILSLFFALFGLHALDEGEGVGIGIKPLQKKFASDLGEIHLVLNGFQFQGLVIILVDHDANRDSDALVFVIWSCVSHIAIILRGVKCCKNF